MKLSVVIPAYNEEQRISATLGKIIGYFNTHEPADTEIIVVDDGSEDKTSEVVNRYATEHKNVRLIVCEKNLGKGYTVKVGVSAAVGDNILFTDADSSTPIEEIEKLYPYLGRGYDFVFGSRALKESEIIVKQNWLRQTMGKTFNLFLQLILVSGIKDTQCGFKLFTRHAADRVFPYLKLTGFSFDAELTFIAIKRGLKIKDVPVRWINSFESKVRIVSDSAVMFIDLLRIRAYYTFNMYEFQKKGK
jgi:dolichyl-phosphate beta-glucosyltransferase